MVRTACVIAVKETFVASNPQPPGGMVKRIKQQHRVLEIIMVTPFPLSTPPPNPLVAVGASAIDNSGRNTMRPLDIFQNKKTSLAIIKLPF